MINNGFFVEMEGRGYTDLRTNTNEEFILKSMESSNKALMPNMEMAGFRNHLQTLHTDSEEHIKSWITSEESHHFNSLGMVQCTPQALGRMARELNYVTTVDDEHSTTLDQDSFRNMVEVPPSNPHLDKAWFHSTQPMTRSRSSDLRRHFATLQNFQTSVTMKTMHDVPGFNIKHPKQETENSNGFCEAPFGNILNHLGTLVSSQNSSLPKFFEKQDSEDGSLGVYGVQEVIGDMSLDQNRQRTYLNISAAQVTNSHYMATTCESSIQVVSESKENGIGAGAGATDYMSIADDQKPKERLVQTGSMTSADPTEEGEATKKRRVERSRKMAEAKERILTPIVPSDMQSIVKRCEILEKEVRSLKLNLAFMNRKDSEQTKQLEELHIQHGELTEEKERLLEEIERILATRRKM